MAEAAELGFMLNLGVEPELYVFDPASLERSDGYLEPMARSGELAKLLEKAFEGKGVTPTIQLR